MRIIKGASFGGLIVGIGCLYLSFKKFIIADDDLLGGSEDVQAARIRQHGVDMASFSDNPSGAACQKAMKD